MRNLPTGFNEWPADAQKEFLLQARNRADLIELMCNELGIELDDETLNSGGRIAQKTLIDIWFENHEQ